MPVAHGDFQLGADAVGAGNEHGVAPAFAVELKERAEPADAARERRAERCFAAMAAMRRLASSATEMLTPASA